MFKATIQNPTAVPFSGCRRETGNELHEETQTDRKVWGSRVENEKSKDKEKVD
jgi:hypothetical protein